MIDKPASRVYYNANCCSAIDCKLSIVSMNYIQYLNIRRKETVMRMRIAETVIGVGIAVCLLAPLNAHAEGGVYFDNIQITNDGSKVFADNFDERELAEWTNCKDVSIEHDRAVNTSAYLELNKHGKELSRAGRNLQVSKAGKVELSFSVYLPPIAQQFCENGNYCGSANIRLDSGSRDSISVSINNYIKDTGYKLRLGWNGIGGQDLGASVDSWTDKVVLRLKNGARSKL